jgi:RNA polymerase-associated protein RTF1
MEGANGRSFVVDQYAKLAHGKAIRDFPFIACSDSPFSDVRCIPQHTLEDNFTN